MNLAKYPYNIYKINKLIKKEESFIGKYFLAVDLFDSIIKLLSFIGLSFNPKEDKLVEAKDNIKNLKKLFSAKVRSNLGLSKGTKLLNKLETIKEFLTQNELKDIQDEAYYELEYNKLNKYLADVLTSLNVFDSYKILVPYKINKATKKISFITFTGKPTIEKLDYFEDIKLENFYLSFQKELKELKTHFFNSNLSYDKDENINKYFDVSINTFIKFLTNNDAFKLEFEFFDKKVKLEYSDEFYLERAFVIEKVNKFIIEKKFGYFFLLGAIGFGKTSFLENYKKSRKDLNFFQVNIQKGKNAIDVLGQLLQQITKTKLNKADLMSLNKDDFNYFFEKLDKKRKNIIIFDDIHYITNYDKFLAVFSDILPNNTYIMFTMSAKESLILPQLQNMEVFNMPVLSQFEAGNLYRVLIDQKNIPEEQVNQILLKNYGLPLYTKLDFFEKLEVRTEYVGKIRNSLTNLLKESVNKIETEVSRHQKDFKNYSKYIFGLLSICLEGLTRIEIKNILDKMPDDIVGDVIDKAGDFLIKVNGRYKLSNNLFKTLRKNLSSAPVNGVLFSNNSLTKTFSTLAKSTFKTL